MKSTQPYRSSMRPGIAQIIPMIILAVLALSSFIVISRVETHNQDIRSRAAEQGPYPTALANKPTSQPSPTTDPCANLTGNAKFICMEHQPIPTANPTLMATIMATPRPTAQPTVILPTAGPTKSADPCANLTGNAKFTCMEHQPIPTANPTLVAQAIATARPLPTSVPIYITVAPPAQSCSGMTGFEYAQCMSHQNTVAPTAKSSDPCANLTGNAKFNCMEHQPIPTANPTVMARALATTAPTSVPVPTTPPGKVPVGATCGGWFISGNTCGSCQYGSSGTVTQTCNPPPKTTVAPTAAPADPCANLTGNAKFTCQEHQPIPTANPTVMAKALSPAPTTDMTQMGLMGAGVNVLPITGVTSLLGWINGLFATPVPSAAPTKAPLAAASDPCANLTGNAKFTCQEHQPIPTANPTVMARALATTAPTAAANPNGLPVLPGADWAAGIVNGVSNAAANIVNGILGITPTPKASDPCANLTGNAKFTCQEHQPIPTANPTVMARALATTAPTAAPKPSAVPSTSSDPCANLTGNAKFTCQEHQLIPTANPTVMARALATTAPTSVPAPTTIPGKLPIGATCGGWFISGNTCGSCPFGSSGTVTQTCNPAPKTTVAPTAASDPCANLTGQAKFTCLEHQPIPTANPTLIAQALATPQPTTVPVPTTPPGKVPVGATCGGWFISGNTCGSCQYGSSGTVTQTCNPPPKTTVAPTAGPTKSADPCANLTGNAKFTCQEHQPIPTANPTLMAQALATVAPTSAANPNGLPVLPGADWAAGIVNGVSNAAANIVNGILGVTPTPKASDPCANLTGNAKFNCMEHQPIPTANPTVMARALATTAPTSVPVPTTPPGKVPVGATCGGWFISGDTCGSCAYGSSGTVTKTCNPPPPSPTAVPNQSSICGCASTDSTCITNCLNKQPTDYSKPNDSPCSSSTSCQSGYCGSGTCQPFPVPTPVGGNLGLFPTITPLPQAPVTPAASPTPFQYRTAEEIAKLQRELLGVTDPTKKEQVGCGTAGSIVVGPNNGVYGCSSGGTWKNLSNQGYGADYLTERPVWLEGSKTLALINQTVDAVKAKQEALKASQLSGIPVPTAAPSTPCAGGASSGTVSIGSGYSSGSGKSEIWECGSNGAWKQCPTCLLSSIPSYLQTKDAYLTYLKTRMGADADTLASFSTYYDTCAKSSSDASSCVSKAVAATEQDRESKALKTYADAYAKCQQSKGSGCEATALNAIGNTGLTQVALQSVAATYQTELQIAKNQQTYADAVNTYLHCTKDCTGEQTEAIHACLALGYGESTCSQNVTNQYNNIQARQAFLSLLPGAADYTEKLNAAINACVAAGGAAQKCSQDLQTLGSQIQSTVNSGYTLLTQTSSEAFAAKCASEVQHTCSTSDLQTFTQSVYNSLTAAEKTAYDALLANVQRKTYETIKTDPVALLKDAGASQYGCSVAYGGDCTPDQLKTWQDAIVSTMNVSQTASFHAYVAEQQQKAVAVQQEELKTSSGYKDYLNSHPGATVEQFQKDQEEAFARFSKNLKNLGIIDEEGPKYEAFVEKVKSGEVNVLGMETTYNDARDVSKAGLFQAGVLFFNDLSSGATKRGNDIQMNALSQYEAQHKDNPLANGQYGDMVSNAVMLADSVNIFSTVPKAIAGAMGNKQAAAEAQTQWDAIRGGVEAGAMPAAVVTAGAAIALAGPMMIAPVIAAGATGAGTAVTGLTIFATTLTTAGTGVGVVGTTMSLAQTADQCSFTKSMNAKGCALAAANTTISAVGTGLGVVAGAAQITQLTAATALKAAGEATTQAAMDSAIQIAEQNGAKAAVLNASKAMQVVSVGNKVVAGANTVLFGSQAADTCFGEHPNGTACATNVTMALGSLFSLGGQVIESQAVKTTLQGAGKFADVGGSGLATASDCILMGAEDPAGCAIAASGFVLAGSGVAKEYATRNVEEIPKTTNQQVEAAEKELLSLYDNGTLKSDVTPAELEEKQLNLRTTILQRSQELGEINLALETKVTKSAADMSKAEGELTSSQSFYKQAAQDLQNYLASHTSSSNPINDVELGALQDRASRASNELISAKYAVEQEQSLLTTNPRTTTQKIGDTIGKLLGIQAPEVTSLQKAQQEFAAIAKTSSPDSIDYKIAASKVQYAQDVIAIQNTTDPKTLAQLQSSKIATAAFFGRGEQPVDTNLSEIQAQVDLANATAATYQEDATALQKRANQLKADLANFEKLGAENTIKEYTEKYQAAQAAADAAAAKVKAAQPSPDLLQQLTDAQKAADAANPTKLGMKISNLQSQLDQANAAYTPLQTQADTLQAKANQLKADLANFEKLGADKSVAEYTKKYQAAQAAADAAAANAKLAAPSATLVSDLATAKAQYDTIQQASAADRAALTQKVQSMTTEEKSQVFAKQQDDGKAIEKIMSDIKTLQQQSNLTSEDQQRLDSLVASLPAAKRQFNYDQALAEAVILQGKVGTTK